MSDFKRLSRSVKGLTVVVTGEALVDLLSAGGNDGEVAF